MAMKWFWRMVCAPDCTDACQINCPGCHELADEWKEQGYVTAVTEGRVAPRRWQDFRYAISCWSRSASARALRRLDPRRVWRRDLAPISATAGCGCHVPAGAELLAGMAAGSDDPIRGEVRQYYDLRARNVKADACCTPALSADVSCVPEYRASDLSVIPSDAIMASLGCGNPFARADLQPGEVVLDLGSGGGMDALVAAGRVGAEGHVFGLDMSDEMLSLAQRNAAAAGVVNVGFLKGDLESVPLPSRSIDVIISNCVVNLVPDKARALREAHRVLRPGGRLSISDIVTRVPVPEHLKHDLSAWAACIGGALSEDEYRQHLEAAGFVDIHVERDREYTVTDARAAGVMPILERAGVADALKLGFANTSVRARKLVHSPTESGSGEPATSGAPAASKTSKDSPSRRLPVAVGVVSLGPE
jgi:arsenite methyltransferase